jgi:hypothetical protein
MSFGIMARGDDGYLSLHSDYSTLVYAGEFSKNADPVQPVYTGDNYVSISAAQKSSNYDMGWIVQYKISLDVGYIAPFYRPSFDYQKIAIMDVIHEGSTWVVNLIFSGSSSQYPRVFAFAPLTELSSVPLNARGIRVYDSSSKLVYTDSKPPLKIDDVIQITFPTLIKTGSKGSCGNDHSCHVNFTHDQSTAYTGTVNNSGTRLYHIVPSAYGGLAYQNSGSGSGSCGFLGFGSYPWAWKYQSWDSYRGVMSHPRNTKTHNATWLADFGGAAHQYAEGGCGYGGILGALVGIALVVATGGAALAVIGGALVGFAVGELTVGTTPSLKAYDQDISYDTNNPGNLLITDMSYYGLTGADTPPTEDGTLVLYDANNYWRSDYYNYTTTIYWGGVDILSGVTGLTQSPYYYSITLTYDYRLGTFHLYYKDKTFLRQNIALQDFRWGSGVYYEDYSLSVSESAQY